MDKAGINVFFFKKKAGYGRQYSVVIYNLQGAVCLLIRSWVWKSTTTVPCFAKIPLRCNTCSLPGPFLDMYKKGARIEESIDGMGSLCCAAMIPAF